MRKIKLLPCPFCGGEAEMNITKTTQGQTAMIVCSGCSCMKKAIKPYNYKGDIGKELAKGWNTRKPMERIVERLEEELRLADKEKERCARENTLQFDSTKGYATGVSTAIEIVKTGGTDGTL